MADTKITSLLTPQVTTNPATDVLPIVNIADTLMASSGSTRKITVNSLLGAGGTATLASATITGDLTVDTSTLKVDSALNNVGIGTASPNNNTNRSTLTINNATWGGELDINVGATNHARFGTDNFDSGTSCRIQSIDGIILKTAGTGLSSYLQLISSTGITTWYDGAGGTRMTLNATGLGVGVSPFYKFQSVGIAAATDASFNGSGGNLIGALLNSDVAGSGANPGLDLRRWTGTATNHGTSYIATNSAGDTLFYNGAVASNTRATSLKMTLDASGRLLVGGTSPFGIPNGAGTSFFPLIQTITTSGSAAVSAFVNDGTNNRRIGLFVDNDNGITGISVGRSGGSAPFVYRDATDERLRIDTSGNLITTVPTTPPTLAANSQMVFNLTSNTNLRISVRGTDGTTRTANITLA